MRTNTLSAFGRMSYGAHMLAYPAFFCFVAYGVMPWKAEQDKKAVQEEFDNMSKARAVDPDLFNPFTPIPYHNNPELQYVYAGIRMKNYINENHLNVNDYVWKNYHNSYDHNNARTFMYNWVPK